jgi:hypothetical protein
MKLTECNLHMLIIYNNSAYVEFNKTLSIRKICVDNYLCTKVMWSLNLTHYIKANTL